MPDQIWRWRCSECTLEGFVNLPHPDPMAEAMDMHAMIKPECTGVLIKIT